MPWIFATGIAGLLAWLGLQKMSKTGTPSMPGIPTLPAKKVEPPPEILDALKKASAMYDVPLQILVGMAHTESRFNPRAVSSVGAMGLMQLMPVVIKNYGITDPYDPLQSAMGAARFLSKYYKVYGNWPQTLAAYNWGPGNVKENPQAGQWPDATRTYVARVQRAVV